MRVSRTVLAGLTAGSLIVAAPAGAATVQSAQSTFEADAAGATVVTAPGADRATFLKGTVGAARLGSGSATAQAATALKRYGAGIGVASPSSQLKLQGVTTNRSGTRTARYAQVVDGVPVLGSGVNVTLGEDGKGLRAIAATVRPGVAGVSTTPAVSQTAAENTAAARMGASRELHPSQLVVFAPEGATARLAWAVDRLSADGTKRELTLVDARSGEVADVQDRIMDARDRSIYDMRGQSVDLFLPGTLVRSEGQGSNGDADADAAYSGTGATYDYYASTFGRDSYDDRGAELISSVNYGRGYENAFWNGEQMVYGDGFATLDVTAHELTHAVTENTAGLQYSNQSGALNESISDMAGWDLDPGDTTLGEDLPIGAIRDMSNPGAYGQPASGSQYVCTTSDNGGVHTNSGITNKVYSNIVAALGRSTATQIWYGALTGYLTPGSSFADARAAFISAAGDVGADTTAVANAWSAQGIGANWAPSC